MVVIENQGFHFWIGMVPLDAGAYGGELCLVHHFIALKIKRPVAGAGVLGDHFLLGIDKSAVGHTLIPHRFNNPYLGVANGLDSRQGVI